MIDDQSDAGSWKDALRYPHSIRVSDFHAPLSTAPERVMTGGTVEQSPAVPPLCDDLLHGEHNGL